MVEAFEAVVTEIHLESTTRGRALWRIALDRTSFAPGDAGEFVAEARSGTKLLIPVLRVESDAAGTVWHLVEKPLTEGTKIVARPFSTHSSLVHS